MISMTNITQACWYWNTPHWIFFPSYRLTLAAPFTTWELTMNCHTQFTVYILQTIALILCTNKTCIPPRPPVRSWVRELAEIWYHTARYTSGILYPAAVNFRFGSDWFLLSLMLLANKHLRVCFMIHFSQLAISNVHEAQWLSVYRWLVPLPISYVCRHSPVPRHQWLSTGHGARLGDSTSFRVSHTRVCKHVDVKV